MTSNSPNRTAQAQRLIPGLIMAILLAVLSACSGSAGNPSPPSSAGSPTANQYGQFDQEVSRLLDRQATWQAPKRIKVDETARVGLVIGDSSLLKTEISQLVPRSYPVSAGSVKVGSTISVQLFSDSGDASVTPDNAIDKSMGEHTALLWTWYVHPAHPDTSPGLFLTAEIDTKMSDGHVMSEELALTIPVDRTLQYTGYQIFTNYLTWAAIASALAGLWTLIRKKRKKRQQRAALFESDEY